MKNAEEAIRIIQAFQEFASAEKMKDLSDVFHNDNDLEEAAVSLICFIFHLNSAEEASLRKEYSRSADHKVFLSKASAPTSSTTATMN